jgi:hypothetical protein
MSVADSLEEDERLSRLEAEILPLLDHVRGAVADPLVVPGREVVRKFLADAPVDTCVKLFETWRMAEGEGTPVQVVAGRMTPENRFILDLVTTIYSVPNPSDVASQFDTLAKLVQ